MDESSALQPIEGFAVHGDEIRKAALRHYAPVTDCLQVPSGEHTDCWHKKHTGRFRDLCLTCDKPCQAFPAKERPYYARLLSVRENGGAEQVLAASEPGLQALRAIYARIPSTTCQSCGQCCRLYTVEAFSVEYLLMASYLRQHFSEQERARFRGLAGLNVALELRGLDDRRRCPFQQAESGHCLIHPVKPLACRLFLCEKTAWAGSAFDAQSSLFYREVASLCQPCFIVDDREVIVTKTNEFNRWFIL